MHHGLPDFISSSSQCLVSRRYLRQRDLELRVLEELSFFLNMGSLTEISYGVLRLFLVTI